MINLTINGTPYALDVDPDTKLSDLLRTHLGLTGTKVGCGEGGCGTCTVLLDGRPVRACVTPARRAEGKQVLTVEGLAASWGDPGELHPLQSAFVEHGAVQCGFCTPGMLMAAAALFGQVVEEAAEAGEAELDARISRALRRNACRCTGYASIVRAVRSALHEAKTGEPLPPIEIETLEPLTVVGRSHARPDVVGKVTGALPFADDLTFEGMLYGATLRAAYPHARILSIDTRGAAALPGVRAVLTHRDVPGPNRHGIVIHDWPVLCDDKVRYTGDAVAIVAADSPEIARQALDLIRVAYEPLPVVASAEAARRPEAALVHEEWKTGNLLDHIVVRLGDVEEGLAEADVVIEREYRTPTYEHMFLEPECSIGVPAGYDADHAKLTVYVGSQIPYGDRQMIAVNLGLKEDQVRVVGTPIGGAFGGKEDVMGQIHAALLAEATGRPVKVLYDRRESLLAHPKRHATVIRITTAARRDGTLTAVRAELTGDAGAYASLSTKVLQRATTHASGPYQVPHVQIDCYAMYTNNPPAGAFRGFGVTQSAFAVESNMDILADELGLDPFELRRINALRVGSTTATGQVLRESTGLLDCLDWVQSRMGELSHASPIDQCAPGSPIPQFPNPQIAWGLAAAYKNTGLGGGADDAAGAEIEVYPDGSAEVRSSSADLGQGLQTVLAQFVAEELGLPYDCVRVLLSDTDRCPDGGPTTASRQTYITGNAARQAARAMRQRLAGVVAERWDVPPDEIVFEDGTIAHLLPPASPASGGGEDDQRPAGSEPSSPPPQAGRGLSQLPNHRPHAGRDATFAQAVQWLLDEGRQPTLTYTYHAPATKPLGQGGDMHFAFGYSVQAAQVAVDPNTGEVQVLHFVAACDAGRAINPIGVLGQIEGGVVMGIGTALTEAYRLKEGVPQTRRWRDYRIPLIEQVPPIEAQIVEHPTAEGPYGAKGIGELPSIPVAPAICNAIYGAIGVRVQGLPVQAEQLHTEANRGSGTGE
jgi:xanthine dehydrogenase molybdenum-binding subunit